MSLNVLVDMNLSVEWIPLLTANDSLAAPLPGAKTRMLLAPNTNGNDTGTSKPPSDNVNCPLVVANARWFESGG